jgi:hypothetical protein
MLNPTAWPRSVLWPSLHNSRSRGSSVGIVSDYGLDDQAIGVRSPAGTKDFSSSLCDQTGSEAQPASCTMGTGGPFPGAKRGRDVTLTTHPHLVPKSGMRSYTSSPPSACMACSGTAFCITQQYFCKSMQATLAPIYTYIHVVLGCIHLQMCYIML